MEVALLLFIKIQPPADGTAANGTIYIGSWKDKVLFTIADNTSIENILTIRNNLRQLVSDLDTNTQDRCFYYDYFDEESRTHTGLFIGVDYINNKPRTYVRAVEYIYKKNNKTKLLDSYSNFLHKDGKYRYWKQHNQKASIPGIYDCSENYIKNSFEFQCNLQSTYDMIRIPRNEVHKEAIIPNDIGGRRRGVNYRGQEFEANN